MTSLQVLTPKRDCIYNCPFCISKTHTHDNNFIDNYTLNHQLWVVNFIQVLTTYQDLKYIVITGINEPMQDKECVSEIINITRMYRPDIQIEIQTRYYKEEDVYDSIDVVAYSISSYNLLDKIKPKGYISRYVILLTKDFNSVTLEDILAKIPGNVSQITFKVLQDSDGVNPDIDNWINNNKVSSERLCLLDYEIKRYKGCKSIRLDYNCMDSKNRYQIFRSDGYLYDDWETKEKVLVK